MYEARKICNFLIARRDTHKFPLTNLRLNKLLYFIHGWGLTSRADGLVRNHFLAWTHGPVVRPVYDAFKPFGDDPITEPAKYLDYITGQNRAVAYDDIAPDDATVIDRVFRSYDRFTTGQLVTMSHMVGGPWHTVYSAWAKDNRLNLRIPNGIIRAHFLQEAGGKIRH
jgi:uncharacterized phage-associated protein